MGPKDSQWWSVYLYNHIRVYICLYNIIVIWQWIWTIKLSSVIILMVGAKLTRCHRISQFLKPGLQRRVYAAPNHNSTRSREWWTIGGTTGQKCSTLWYYMILPHINTMKYKWFTQFDKAFVLVPSWLSPWLMAMSAKSRLECSLLVVVVGVSICDAILGGTKQTRHAAWMLCKVMSRIGNFCGAVRGYFHNVMHTRSFYDCFIYCCFSSTTPWHEICFDNVWPCYIQKIVCNFTLPVWHSPFQTEDGSTLRRNVLIQYDLFKFDVSCIFIIFGVWYASFLQCRCTKSFRILRKHRSKDYSYSPPQRTWPKIWYIKFGGGEHYWLRIKDIFWGSSRRIQAHRIPAWTFTLSRFGLSKWLDSRNCLTICCWSAFHTPWSCQPHTCIHIIWLAKHLDATDFAWVRVHGRGKSSGLGELKSGMGNPANSYIWMFQAHKKHSWNRQRQILAESHLILFLGFKMFREPWDALGIRNSIQCMPAWFVVFTQQLYTCFLQVEALRQIIRQWIMNHDCIMTTCLDQLSSVDISWHPRKSATMLSG